MIKTFLDIISDLFWGKGDYRSVKTEEGKKWPVGTERPEKPSAERKVAPENRPGTDRPSDRTKAGESREETRTPEKPSDGSQQPAEAAGGPSEKHKGSETQAFQPRKTPAKRTARKKRKPPWKPTDFPVEPEEGKTRFHDLNLPRGLLHAVCDLEFKFCTPIQAEILPRAMEGRDATGQAQTGTGKTAAFLIAIMTNMIRNPIKEKRAKGKPRALILAPTRELAIQIEKDAMDLAKYCGIGILCMIGGTGFDRQQNFLKKRPIDIAVATPGRLLDFARRGVLDLKNVETLVIDEADRMLDMGFIPDITRIVHMTPPKEKRQTLFFSATLTDEVLRLASRWTRESFRAEIEPDRIEAESVDQKVYLTTAQEKFYVLYNVVTKLELTRVLIFTNRRDQARDLSAKLCRAGIKATLLSGELTQSKRTKALENFRSGEINCLVATDVAARGLHIEGISHVVNYNIPQEAEHYVHRIGRTGRAGSSGVSISFADEKDSFNIPPIEKVLGHKLECEYPPDDLVEEPDLSNVVPVKMEPFGPPAKPRGRQDKRRPSRRKRTPSNKKDAGNAQSKADAKQP